VKDGEDLFEALYTDPARLEKFLREMTGISLLAARAIAEGFSWMTYRSFADMAVLRAGKQIGRVLVR
jgi:hypothetical protein